MPAPRRETPQHETPQHKTSQKTSQHEPRTPTPEAAAGACGARSSDVSVRELLASCAAASAVSTPPAHAEGETAPEAERAGGPVSAPSGAAAARRT